MPGITIVSSNRLENLVERLARTLRTPAAAPLKPEIVVVQSRGMERWVSMELARINGICAHVRFPFPKLFFEEYFRGLLPAGREADEDPWALGFRIMRWLDRLRGAPAMGDLRGYLEGDREPLKRYQLSRVLADLFDQYAVFRPDMLQGWEAGRAGPDPSQRWQSLLWRELIGEEPALNRARIWQERLRAAAAGAVERIPHPDLPERIAVFGISYLPPLYLEGLRAVARTTDVLVFALNPCREYWADIVSDREAGAIGKSRPEILDAPEEFHLERGNRLLASMGAAGRDFFSLLAGLEAAGEELFEAPEGDSLLARLQRDILELREPEGPSGGGRAAAACGSIQVHACHSPMREVEVLHDALLSFFEQDPGLTPEEIVVMAPDIGLYAPFIEAVFGAPPEESQRIPYHVADRGPAGETRVFAALDALLELKDSRFGAAETLRLLEFPSIRGRFGIAEGELAILREWVASSGVRWGRDAAARAALGLPAEARNTWRAGIERMLLGYAMPSGGRELYGDILAFDAVEGQQGRLLGDFIDFLEELFTLASELDSPRSLGAWGRKLAAVVDDFIASDPATEAESLALAAILAELPALEARAAFSEAVPLDVVRGLLAERLQAERIGWGFLSGGVTFCAMLPMRTIPFKIVCLIGMNHDAFPREHHPPDFDLVARHPRRGDRSRRNDDKYLFLEALLAARRALYISYVGQGIQDNSRRPPSVLVSELLETLDTVYGVRLDPASDSRVTLHRLQAFSPDYFRRTSTLVSYSRDDFLACRRAAERAPAPAFFSERLPLDPEEAAAFHEVPPERLAAFFRSPARYLLQHRLGVRLNEGAGPPEEREPFALDPLARYRLGQALLDAYRTGGDPEAVVAAFRAAGELPHGTAGEILSRRLAADVGRFHAAVRKRLPPPAGVEIDLDRKVSGFHLGGRLRGLSREGCLSLRYADLNAVDFLEHWIRHLCLCLAAGESLVCRSLLIGKDAAWSFERIAGAEPILSSLLELYRRGLEEPLPFFPKLSLGYFETAQRDRVKALAQARRDWVGSDIAPGPAADPCLELCFGQGEPIGEEFAALSEAVFGPLFVHGRREPLT